MTEFINVGTLTDLADGSIFEPGAVKTLDTKAQDDPFNQILIDEGHIVPLTDGEPKATSKKGGDK